MSSHLSSHLCAVIMATRYGNLIVCGCLWMRFFGALCLTTNVKCGTSDFTQIGYYNKTTNRTVVGIWLEPTEMLSIFNGTGLVGAYPWINVSGTEDEEELAQSQMEFLTALVGAFPDNDTLALTYQVANDADSVTVRVDSATVAFFANLSQYEFEKMTDADAKKIKNCMKNDSFTTFLESKTTVLQRWRAICNETMTRDTPDGINVTCGGR